MAEDEDDGLGGGTETRKAPNYQNSEKKRTKEFIVISVSLCNLLSFQENLVALKRGFGWRGRSAEKILNGAASYFEGCLCSSLCCQVSLFLSFVLALFYHFYEPRQFLGRLGTAISLFTLMFFVSLYSYCCCSYSWLISL